MPAIAITRERVILRLSLAINRCGVRTAIPIKMWITAIIHAVVSFAFRDFDVADRPATFSNGLLYVVTIRGDVV